jgi:integrase/recombinase XerD
MSAEIPSAHITSQSLVTPTINAWRIYLEDQDSSPHTIKAFVADMRLLASFLPPDRRLGDITTTDLNNYLEWMQSGRGVPCSPKTMSRRITSIKSFFRWLHGNGVILVNPAEKVVSKSVISPLPKVLTGEEQTLIFETANRHRLSNKPDARYDTLISLLLNTGIKKSECLALSPNHVDLESKNSPQIFIRYSNPEQRYKERNIQLPGSWVTAYREYSGQYEISDRLFPWSQRRLEYLLEDISNECGLKKHLSFEMCRWTCALNDWQMFTEKDKIRQKLGISKVQWREVSSKLARLAQGDNFPSVK